MIDPGSGKVTEIARIIGGQTESGLSSEGTSDDHQFLSETRPF
jgi:hypothetical protein